MARRNGVCGRGCQLGIVWSTRGGLGGRLRGVLHWIPRRRLRPDVALVPRVAVAWMVARRPNPQCFSVYTRVLLRTGSTPVTDRSSDRLSLVAHRRAYLEVPR